MRAAGRQHREGDLAMRIATSVAGSCFGIVERVASYLFAGYCPRM